MCRAQARVCFCWPTPRQRKCSVQMSSLLPLTFTVKPRSMSSLKMDRRYRLAREKFQTDAVGIYQCCGAATFWAAPAPDSQGPGADSGSDLLGSAPALLA